MNKHLKGHQGDGYPSFEKCWFDAPLVTVLGPGNLTGKLENCDSGGPSCSTTAKKNLTKAPPQEESRAYLVVSKYRAKNGPFMGFDTSSTGVRQRCA